MTYSPSSQRRALIVKNDFSPFGNKLIESGYVSREQMQQAMSESRKFKKPLTEVLESLTGRQLSPDLLRHYKKQQLFELKIIYGVEFLDPDISEISITQVGELIQNLIPIDICRRYRLLPLSQNNTHPNSVLVAMVEPDNLDAQDNLNRILRPRRLGLQRLVITLEDFQQLLLKYLDQQVERQKQSQVPKTFDVNLNLEDLKNIDLEDAPAEVDADLGAALEDAETGPVVALVNKILVKALQEKVSDIHIEPQEEYLRIRFEGWGATSSLRPSA